jgi:ubiquinone/menaquinone biosynthesis C-methylase UbiE
VGSGTGFLALILAQLGHRVTGVDLADGMLATARAKAAALTGWAAPPAFVKGDATDPPVPPESVDVVISRHVLWTLPDPARAFAAWRRVLRPGGRAIAIDGLWQFNRQQAEQAHRTEPGEPAPPLPPPNRELWERHYTEAVRASLPLFGAASLDPVVAIAREAGFADVRVTELDELHQVETAARPNRTARRPRYAITAIAP